MSDIREFSPIEWTADGRVRLLDQTLLPNQETYLEISDYRDLARAIREMRVRGAPLIGITAAYALALAAREFAADGIDQSLPQIRAAAKELRATRPTAVNLTWALDRLLTAVKGSDSASLAADTIESEARRIHEEDIAANRRIGENGAELLASSSSILTHCNAGALATGGYGTALGVIRSLHSQGNLKQAYVTETRPLLQGARLTTWELLREGIPHTLIVDSASGSLLRRKLVQAVVVGADRIAANGDVANKIGTYAIAVLAKENDVDFYVAAPTSTIDLGTPSGNHIPIEERSPDEVTAINGTAAAVETAKAMNPAFDVTPAEYVTAIITENGVARRPYTESLVGLLKQETAPRG